MHADQLFTGISQLATPRGQFAVRGPAMRELDVIDQAALAVTDGRVAWVGPADAWRDTADVITDLGGRAVVPGIVDPHTHAVWAGDRLADFEARCAGVPYEEILALGGGIRRTMRLTASASMEELVAGAERRLRALIRSGATTIEVKSGYGGTHEAEIASLEAIRNVAPLVPARIIPTLLLHVPPRELTERDTYLRMATERLIPDVARRRLARAVDVFIEREAFSLDEARAIFEAARSAGLAIKAHVDQFHAIGGLELALEFDAISVDHLEASGAPQIQALAASSTVAVILPGVTIHLGVQAAPGRAMIDAGCAVAVATDLNPGSAPIYSSQLAMALAVRINELTPAEALTAGTANAAAALGLDDVGRLAEGQHADFIVVDGEDWRTMVYVLGGSPVADMYIAGKRVA
ncbi:MAG: imidazolonepropionase [Gemmatimonadales bacterium]